MKKFMLYLTILLLGSIYAFGQAVVAPVVVATPVIAAPSWLEAHGGMMAVVVAVMLGLNAILSGLRDLLYFLDGVPKGAPIPANYTGLTLVNKICLWLGKILDYVQGNVAH